MTAAPATTMALYAEIRDGGAPRDAGAQERELADATEVFLIEAEPLIAIARGPKRQRMRDSWMRLAAANARRRQAGVSGPLPNSRRGVALALHRAVLELCQAYGIGGLDLVEAYNALRDHPDPEIDLSDRQARMRALFALLIVEGSL